MRDSAKILKDTKLAGTTISNLAIYSDPEVLNALLKNHKAFAIATIGREQKAKIGLKYFEDIAYYASSEAVVDVVLKNIKVLKSSLKLNDGWLASIACQCQSEDVARHIIHRRRDVAQLNLLPWQIASIFELSRTAEDVSCVLY